VKRSQDFEAGIMAAARLLQSRARQIGAEGLARKTVLGDFESVQEASLVHKLVGLLLDEIAQSMFRDAYRLKEAREAGLDLEEVEA
jgi:hypothetical protein